MGVAQGVRKVRWRVNERGPFPDLLGLTNASRTSGGPEVLRGPDPFRHNIGVRKGSGNQLHPGEI